MKAVHLVPFYEPGYTGGIQKYVAELTTRQARAGLQVSVLSVSMDAPSSGPTEHEGSNGVAVRRRRALGVWQRTPFQPLTLLDVGRIEADIVHLHSPSPWFEAALLAARPRRGRLVVTLHNGYPSTTLAQRGLSLAARLLLFRALRAAGAIIAPHPAFFNAFVPDAIARDLDGRLHFVPPGVDHDRFRPLGPLERDGPVLFVGHLRPEKGLHVLVDAMALLPGRSLEVMAAVSYERSYYQRLRRRAAAALGDRVRFHFDADEETLVQAYNRAACVVVPSLELDSWSLALLEAAACGAACVRSDIPGLAWADFAVEAPAGDAGALARAILRAIEQRPGLAARARARADEYSWGRTFRETLDVYRAACSYG